MRETRRIINQEVNNYLFSIYYSLFEDYSIRSENRLFWEIPLCTVAPEQYTSDLARDQQNLMTKI